MLFAELIIWATIGAASLAAIAKPEFMPDQKGEKG